MRKNISATNVQICYSEKVHKSFYASGFLYHTASQRILLQQIHNGNEVQLVLFRGKSEKGRDPQIVFQEAIEDALGISIPKNSIHPVYDYIHDRFGEQFIFYVEVTDFNHKTYVSKQKTEWFQLSKLSKYAMSEQTRHDIIIAERVIRSLMVKTPVLVPQHFN